MLGQETLPIVLSTPSSTFDNRGARVAAWWWTCAFDFDGDSAQRDNCELLADLRGCRRSRELGAVGMVTLLPGSSELTLHLFRQLHPQLCPKSLRIYVKI
jgi:hypothetical protein